MANIKNISTPPQLRQGKSHVSDPHAHAKSIGKGYTHTAKHVERYSIPTPGPEDGNLGDAHDDKGPQQYAVNPTASPNTYSGPGGSTRGKDDSD